MYNPHAVLDGVDAHTAPFLFFSLVSFAGLFVWYFEAIRVGERDRAYSMPPVITFVWLAHDATMVAHFSDWFGGPYDHWLMKLFWVAMVATTLVECWFVGQLMRFGRAEIAPFLCQGTFNAAVLAALAGVTAIWLVLKTHIADDLFQVTFGLTAAMFPPFGMALLLRRGSSRGQSVGQWAGFTVAPAAWFVATMIAYGPAFRSWQWVALAVVTTAWGGVVTLMVGQAPASHAPWPEGHQALR